MIKFVVDPEKVVNTILFFAGKCSDPTKMKISKLMFYADKMHLNEYGRPITGDTYIKMKFGPVPSMALNLMRHLAYYEVASELFDQSVTVKGNEIHLLRQFDRKVFSGSDIAVMERVLEKYGCESAFTLSDISHDEPAWSDSEINRKIDFEKFFHSDEDSQRMLNLVGSNDNNLETSELKAARA